jgi:hypothetical protein
MSTFGESCGHTFSEHPIFLSIIALLALGTAGETITTLFNKNAPRDMNCIVQQADQGSSISPGATVALSCTPR